MQIKSPEYLLWAEEMTLRCSLSYKSLPWEEGFL